ncbi:MAG TPA: peptidyl-alpha-hydroxyglycine alpha-amidating lyase family protein [Gemmataceae bacterium]|nr:peptidyl-alpha-hydroxyglycine alpha-amidating lyase family protein [Gemmataceae bacterium]
MIRSPRSWLDAPLRLLLRAGLVGTALLAFTPVLAAQAKYPKVNTAIAYVVDPSWPQRPADVQWDAMPGIAVDAQDRIYLFTRASPPVQVYDSNGKFIRGWGQEHIKRAHHIRIDPEGNVWCADIGCHVVYKFTPEGKLLLTLGTKDHAGCDPSHFNQPTDMAITPSGDIFVSDGYGNARIVHFDRHGKYVKEWGRLGSKPGEFSIPHAIAVDSRGRLYVADRNNARVQVFDQSGRLLDVWSNLVVPWGLWVTKKDEIWVCGSSPTQWRETDSNLGVPPKDQLFMKFNPDGKLLQLWAVPKGVDGLEKPGELNWVHALAVDSHGNIYAGDIVGKRAQKFVRKEP